MAEIALYFDEALTEPVQPVDNGVGEPIEFELRIDKEQIKEMELWAAASEGYIVTDDSEEETPDYPDGVEISPVALNGDQHADKWSFSDDGNTWTDWGGTLAIGEVTESGKKVWIRARAVAGDEVSNDESIGIRAAGVAKEV